MGTGALRRPRAWVDISLFSGSNSQWTYRASGQLVGLAVVRLVVRGLSVAHHRHNVGKRDTWAVVLVRVDKDSQTLKSVCRSEDRALCGALLGEPERKAIAVQIALAVNFEFQLDLSGVSVVSIIQAKLSPPANW